MKHWVGVLLALTGFAIAHPARAADAKSELDALFAEERAFVWREDPLAATYDGVHDYDDRLPSVLPAEQARRLDADRRFLDRLQAIDRGALSNFDAGELRPLRVHGVATGHAREIPGVARAAQQ
jgi:uncharacterized protein (DUF885 family)